MKLKEGPAARIVGATGKVYGLDLNTSSIRVLREKAFKENLSKVELITGTAEDAPICSGCADMVFFGIVLHDFNDPSKVLQNTRKMLKPDGKLVNLDWKKEKMNIGLPLVKRFDEATASRLIVSAGFKIKSV
jgi:ubiquinone/menaquinone biosynthesis C-methylase UbiE